MPEIREADELLPANKLLRYKFEFLDAFVDNKKLCSYSIWREILL